jgi:hypothetical protein
VRLIFANAVLSDATSSYDGRTTSFLSVVKRDASARSGSHSRRFFFGCAVPRMSVSVLTLSPAWRRRAISHAEDEEIRLRVEEDRAPDLIGPVVVVRDAAKRSLDAAEDERQPGERLATEVRVDDARAVGPRVGAPAGRVLILGPHLLLRGQLVQHRVEVARGDADEEARPAHARDVRRRVPARLGDDADLEAATLEEARDEDGTERGMIDVRVAGDDQDVELVPAARAHLLTRGREEARARIVRLLPADLDQGLHRAPPMPRNAWKRQSREGGASGASGG